MAARDAEARLERVFERGLDPAAQVRVANAQRRFFASEAGVLGLTGLAAFLLHRKRPCRAAQHRRLLLAAALGAAAANFAGDFWLRRRYLAELEAVLDAHERAAGNGAVPAGA